VAKTVTLYRPGVPAVDIIRTKEPRRKKRKLGTLKGKIFRKAKRAAAVSVPKERTRIAIRLDDEILAWFRGQVEPAGGGNYQTVINDVLRQHIQRAQEPLEKTLGRVDTFCLRLPTGS
jgi:uncharacterized protein (DUF4415 family)